MKHSEIPILESALEHSFHNPELLQQALTHSSYAHETIEALQASAGDNSSFEKNPIHKDNETMEFLGDAVLGFVTSRELFARFPSKNEGELSKLRAHLVSARHLVQIAKKINLGPHLRLGKGEEKSGGRNKSALLVDALEAVIAALYLDSGLEVARAFILSNIVHPELQRLLQSESGGLVITDYKSALQEVLQSAGRPQPVYTVAKETGPDHKKTFTVEVRLLPRNGARKPDYVTRAEGSSKKSAEQCAARQALEHLPSLPVET